MESVRKEKRTSLFAHGLTTNSVVKREREREREMDCSCERQQDKRKCEMKANMNGEGKRGRGRERGGENEGDEVIGEGVQREKEKSNVVARVKSSSSAWVSGGGLYLLGEGS